MAEQVSPVSQSIAEKLKTLATIKNDIAGAIVGQGGSVSKSDSFSSYASKIAELDPKGKLDTIKIDENGTYYAKDYKMSGFSQVTVNVKSSGSGGSGGGGSSSGGMDSDGSEKIPTFKVSYYEQDGITPVLNSAGEPYVEEVELLQNAPQNAEATNPGAASGQSHLYTFRKWEPEPIKVQHDIKCVAKWKERNWAIEDSWDEIVSNGGAEYDIGDYKMIETGYLTIPASLCPITDGNNLNTDSVMSDFRCKIQFTVEKVYEYENGTTSTWLMKNAIVIYYGSHNGRSPAFKMSGTNWDNSALKKWLNNELLKALPDPLISGIKEVTKYVMGNYPIGGAPAEGVGSATKAKIWVPGHTEMFGHSGKYEGGVEDYHFTSLPLGGSAMGWPVAYWLRSNDASSGYDSGQFRVFNQTVESVQDKDAFIISSGSMHAADHILQPRIGFCL